MSFFNDAQRDGLLTGRYICSECGGLMEFEDEWEDTLVCPVLLICGYLPVLIDKDATALVFFAFIAIPLFFAKENWIY